MMIYRTAEKYLKKELDDATSVGSQLHEILRERIIVNDLIPGSKISEAEIAKYYQTSRQPVREAFIKLSQEGLVQIRPQRETLVKKINYSSVLDIQFIREAVEADIIKSLVAHAQPSIIDHLKERIEEQQFLLKNDISQFAQKDEEFHQSLAFGAGKADVWKMIQPLKSQLDRVRFLTIELSHIKKLIKQHQDIVNAVIKRDVESADKAIRTHLREILSSLPTIQKQYPEYFTS